MGIDTGDILGMTILEQSVVFFKTIYAQIISLLTTSPQDFKDGDVWVVISGIHGAITAIGISLLVIYFLMGLVKTSTTITEVKRPEVAFRLFVRFVLAKALVTYSMNLVLWLIEVSQGLVNLVFGSNSMYNLAFGSMPSGLTDAIDALAWYEQIIMWLPQFLGGVMIVGLSIAILISIYGRFFKLYMYVAFSPIPLASFASSNTQNMGILFLKNLASVVLQVSVVALACMIFSAFMDSGSLGFNLPNTDSAIGILFFYIVELLINMLIFFGLVKISDRITKDILGLS